MKSLFEFKDYKEFLRSMMKSETSPRGLQSAMARHLGCQAAYLYQVLRGKAELTEDQAYKVTTFLEMNEFERDFFLTLVRFSKSSSLALKDYLSRMIDEKIKSYRDLKNYADANSPEIENEFWDYYTSTSTPSLIHILTSSTHYQTSKALAFRLALPESEVLFHLQRLEEMNLVVHKNKKWQFANSSIHFPKDSPFNQTIQKSRRIQSLENLNGSSHPRNLHFTSLFTLDTASLESLKSLITEFVKASQKMIHQGGTDEAFVLNVDLFSPR